LTQRRPPPLAERLGPTACPAATPVLHATAALLSLRHVPSARDATHPCTGPPLLRPVTSTTALRRRSPPLHGHGWPACTTHRITPHGVGRGPRQIFPEAGHAAAPPPKVAGKIFPSPKPTSPRL
jgi:hypothetical protein